MTMMMIWIDLEKLLKKNHLKKQSVNMNQS